MTAVKLDAKELRRIADLLEGLRRADNDTAPVPTGIYLDGTIELRHSGWDGALVGRITNQDDFWIFVAADYDEAFPPGTEGAT